MAEPKRGSLDYLLRRAFDAGLRANALVRLQKVPLEHQQAFLEERYADFRHNPFRYAPEADGGPSAACGLTGCTMPGEHTHGAL